MAGYVAKLKGDINDVRTFIDGRITGYSMSCTKEESYAKSVGGVDFAIDVYERYSMLGKSRVSLQVTYIAHGEDVEVIGISTGGSQAMFVKINVFGEEAFLDSFISATENYKLRNPGNS